MIGDPSGRSQTRPPLTADEVAKNAETYKKQVFKVLDRDKTEVLFNSTWLAGLTAEDVVRISAQYTVARMLERHDFAQALCRVDSPFRYTSFSTRSCKPTTRLH